MEKYEDFARRNQCWDNYYMYSDMWSSPVNRDKDPMRKNYAIAQKVCKTFYSNYDRSSAIPQVGDVVEFSDGYRVYKHATIAENFYGFRFNLLNVCENGSTWTDGNGFSTSGGSFHTIHASRFALVGRAENVMWTWGCHGSGGGQGIYFKLNVRKWIIPYEAPKPPTTVHIYGKRKQVSSHRKQYAVTVESVSSFFYSQSFDSIRAFTAWAEYVGFEYEHIGRLSCRGGLQSLVRIGINSPNQVPADSKPIKDVSNGVIVDAWTKKIGDTIYFYVPNINYWENGTFGEGYKLSQDERMRLFWKYADNPLGV